ncbi:hypothetical protein CB1_000599003 [Camelus ferus]|nr:hypothetical protein CB1_000599003 [Camelus ferus]
MELWSFVTGTLTDTEDYFGGVTSDLEPQGATVFDPDAYKESKGALNEHMTGLVSVLKALDAQCHQLSPPYGTGQLTAVTDPNRRRRKSILNKVKAQSWAAGHKTAEK